MAKVSSLSPRDPDTLRRRERLVAGQEMTIEPTDDMVGRWGLSNTTAAPQDATIDLTDQFHPSRKRAADGE